MDPDAALAALRAEITTFHATDDIGLQNVVSIVEHAEALDGWLTKGGFLPAEWTRPVQGWRPAQIAWAVYDGDDECLAVDVIAADASAALAQFSHVTSDWYAKPQSNNI